MLKKATKWIAISGAILVALLFTPIGGIVNLVVSGGAFLGIIFLLFSVLMDIFRLRDYNYAPHWKGVALKLIGAAGLFLLAGISMTALPAPPLSGTENDCVEIRNRFC